jgi:hypothetical protein
MYAILFLTFLLVIMAHLKIFMFQRMAMALYEELTTFKRHTIKGSTSQTAQVAGNSNNQLLQDIYGLQDKKALFDECQHFLSGRAFESLWRACNGKGLQQAADFQVCILSLDNTSYIKMKHAVDKLAEIAKATQAAQDAFEAVAEPAAAPDVALETASVAETAPDVLETALETAEKPKSEKKKSKTKKSPIVEQQQKDVERA